MRRLTQFRVQPCASCNEWFVSVFFRSSWGLQFSRSPSIFVESSATFCHYGKVLMLFCTCVWLRQAICAFYCGVECCGDDLGKCFSATWCGIGCTGGVPLPHGNVARARLNISDLSTPHHRLLPIFTWPQFIINRCGGVPNWGWHQMKVAWVMLVHTQRAVATTTTDSQRWFYGQARKHACWARL